jgi:hypothetical protein
MSYASNPRPALGFWAAVLWLSLPGGVSAQIGSAPVSPSGGTTNWQNNMPSSVNDWAKNREKTNEEFIKTMTPTGVPNISVNPVAKSTMSAVQNYYRVRFIIALAGLFVVVAVFVIRNLQRSTAKNPAINDPWIRSQLAQQSGPGGYTA